MRLIDIEPILRRKLPLLVMLDEILSAPSIEPKQGEWLFKEITDDYHITGLCSVCKERRRVDNFCPNCGARMEGADNDSNNI